ncbi:MAG TPA: DUF2190 family protein [Tepidisphaeraceae bacterium]|nr:DUF2190 family protein [Tepidisphaeraceae bacterium]
MSQYNSNNQKTFTSGETFSRGVRVKISSGAVVKAGLTDRNWIGVATHAVNTSGDPVNVHLRGFPCQVVASEALSAGALIHTAASGKVGDTATATGYEAGVALTAATADGDLIEAILTGGDTANS